MGKTYRYSGDEEGGGTGVRRSLIRNVSLGFNSQVRHSKKSKKKGNTPPAITLGKGDSWLPPLLAVTTIMAMSQDYLDLLHAMAGDTWMDNSRTYTYSEGATLPKQAVRAEVEIEEIPCDPHGDL